jgi:putative phosphotransacetylase
MFMGAAGLHRAKVEHLVRQAVYQRMGLPLPKAAGAPNPLVVSVSARHCHLTREAVDELFGADYPLTPAKWLYQEGYFAARETVTLIGPRSRVIGNLRILGPCRNVSQVELAYSDAIALGFDLPLRLSGDINGTPGGMLMGPNGFFELKEGVIRAMRHVHMSPADAAFYGVGHGDKMILRVKGACPAAFGNVLVRVGEDHRLELHLDTDEGNACDLRADTPLELVREER